MDVGNESEMHRTYNILMAFVLSLKKKSTEVIKLLGDALNILCDGPYDDYYLDTMALRDVDFTSSFGLNELLVGFEQSEDFEKC